MEELVLTSGGAEAHNFAIKRMPLRNIDIFEIILHCLLNPKEKEGINHEEINFIIAVFGINHLNHFPRHRQAPTG